MDAIVFHWPSPALACLGDSVANEASWHRLRRSRRHPRPARRRPDTDRRIGNLAKYMTTSMTEAADPASDTQTGARRPAGRRSRCRTPLTQPAATRPERSEDTRSERPSAARLLDQLEPESAVQEYDGLVWDVWSGPVAPVEPILRRTTTDALREPSSAAATCGNTRLTSRDALGGAQRFSPLNGILRTLCGPFPSVARQH